MHLIPVWFLLGLVTLVLWGVSMFFGKIAANHIPGSSIKIYLFLGNAFATAYAFKISGFHIEPHYAAGAIAIVAGLCTAFANLFLYIGLNRGGRASILIPLSNLYPLVTFILATVVLKERVSWTQGLGILLSVVAVALLK
jgi:transporter family protein